LKLVGSQLHFAFEISDHIIQIAFDNIPDLTHAIFIRFRGLQSYTRALAIANMVFEAHFKFTCPDVLLGQ
jgi:hypothetical protein